MIKTVGLSIGVFALGVLFGGGIKWKVSEAQNINTGSTFESIDLTASQGSGFLNRGRGGGSCGG